LVSSLSAYGFGIKGADDLSFALGKCLFGCSLALLHFLVQKFVQMGDNHFVVSLQVFIFEFDDCVLLFVVTDLQGLVFDNFILLQYLLL
jgi:hypothetical protein